MIPNPFIVLTPEMSIDTETYDKDLPTLGPGFITRDSYPIGISLANTIGQTTYLPIAHQTGENLPTDQVINYVKDACKPKERTLCFANAAYDLEALDKLNIEVSAQVYDIQVNEALIDENAFEYSLDAIGQRYGIGGKHKEGMEDHMRQKGMTIPSGKGKGQPDYARLRELSPTVVGPYAEQDARLTLQIYELQKLGIKAQGLEQVSLLESKLSHLLWRMRKRGIRVDVEKANEINLRMMISGHDLLVSSGLKDKLDPWSSAQVGEYIRNTYGFDPPRSEKKGADSITNEWLLSLKKPELIKLAEYRKLEKVRRDFVEGTVLEKNHNGRIHCRWYQTRGSGFMSDDDVNGTRSGRIASTDPNMQQVPGRNPILTPMVRGLFLPEEGEQWIKADFQAQEVRVAVHFAGLLGLEGANEFKKHYIEEPMFDFHEHTKNLINKVAPKPIDRSIAKLANLAIQYGIGVKKLSGHLGMSFDDTKVFLGAYHQALPFVKQALKRASVTASDRGYVRTILGRRRHFEGWENGAYGAEWAPPVTKEQAMKLYDNNIRRAETHKAWNSVVQGTSAEMMKLALIKADEAGLSILSTVHDECNISGSNKEADILKECMEEALPLSVPVVAEIKMGDNWGDGK